MRGSVCHARHTPVGDHTPRRQRQEDIRKRSLVRSGFLWGFLVGFEGGQHDSVGNPVSAAHRSRDWADFET